jgi:hypothetical protein
MEKTREMHRRERSKTTKTQKTKGNHFAGDASVAG